MSLTLPTAIAAYLQAKADYDTDALLATLTGDAVITDEGNKYRGEAAIRAWNEKASKEVEAIYEVEDAAATAGRTVCRCPCRREVPQQSGDAVLSYCAARRQDRCADRPCLNG